MIKVVGVRFRNNGRIYYFDPAELEIREGDGVIVETARGTEFGDVAHLPAEVPDEQVVQPLKPVVRVATETDRALRDQYAAREGEAFSVCQKKIAEHKLDMKLVDVEYTFNGSKVIFYFTADERVDFRELVKDLAGHFKTRIELRQIGVRDEARMLGGLGSCGRPVCCKTFLDDFRPVSIKMAKEQNLSLSPTKISGLCGRLMCCLQYEQAGYEEMKKLMPKVGKELQTPDGNGVALENNAITEHTRVKILLPDGSYDQRWYHYTELAKIGDPPPKARPAEKPAQPAEFGNAVYVAPEGTPEISAHHGRRRRSPKPQAEGAAVQPAPAKGNGEAAPKKRPRRRKKPQGEAAAQGAAPESAAPAKAGEAKPPRSRKKPLGDAAQHAGEDTPKKAPQDRKPKMAPHGEPSAAASAADGAAPKKRRRHRGGANRKKRPEGGAPTPAPEG